jgi:hypothetical protein
MEDSQSQQNHQGGNSFTSDIHFGLESQLSNVTHEYSTMHHTMDSAVLDDGDNELTRSNIPTTTMEVATEQVENDGTSWMGGSETDTLSNRLWAQQVVARSSAIQSQSSKGIHAPAVTDDPMVKEEDNESAKFVASRYAASQNASQDASQYISQYTSYASNEDASHDISKDKMLSSDLSQTLEDATAESLQKMARSRDPDAGLVLAARRARKKVRKSKQLKIQKEANEKAKRERLAALNREASMLRKKASTSSHSNSSSAFDHHHHHHHHRSGSSKATKRKGRNNARSNTEKSGRRGPMTSKKDQQQIEQARLRTVKRLREKQEKLRQKEELRRQHDIAQANEKWRLRDAKLAADRQRRMQRKRFEGMKRSALTEKISNRRQEMVQRKQPQLLTSILKRSDGSKTTRTTRTTAKYVKSAAGVLPRTREAGGINARFCGDPMGEDEEGEMADMSAVFEDVEEWVKSVYRGGGESDENLGVRRCGVGASREQEEQEEENEDWQQAEDDEAFLDAILQDS